VLQSVKGPNGVKKRCESITSSAGQARQTAWSHCGWITRDLEPDEANLTTVTLCFRRCVVLSNNGLLQEAITSDPEVMHGTPVFRGTRVPVQTLFDYLENGESLDEFLEGFPTISRELAIQGEGRPARRWSDPPRMKPLSDWPFEKRWRIPTGSSPLAR